MDKALYKLAAQAVIDCYKKPQYDLGTTEFSITREEWKGKPINVLATAGTNEWRDWFKNLDPRSYRGWKKSAYDAAREIVNEIGKLMGDPAPLLVTGHSKGGPTVLRLKELMGHSTYCVVFDPAKGLRKNKNVCLGRTIIFRDPDSIVSYLGWLKFKHPACGIIMLPKDVKFSWLRPWTWFKQHSMSHFLEFVEQMKGDIDHI